MIAVPMPVWNVLGMIPPDEPLSGSHAPAREQVRTLRRRLRFRAAGAAKTAFPRGAWEREESAPAWERDEGSGTGETCAADTRPGVQGFSLGGGRTRLKPWTPAGVPAGRLDTRT